MNTYCINDDNSLPTVQSFRDHKFGEGCILATSCVPHFSISCQLPVKSIGGIVSIIEIISLFYFYAYTLFFVNV